MSGQLDRDQVIDNVLRRSRARQPPDASAATSSACLDAETLALWIEDGLSAVERAAAERHVSDCARCQSVLAALVRTVPVAEPRQSWWRLSRVAWLAPLTAAAAALVIWIAVPSAPPPRAPETPAPLSAPVASPRETMNRHAENAPATTVQSPPGTARNRTRAAAPPAAASAPKEQVQAPASDVSAAAPAAAAPAPATAPPVAARALSEAVTANATSKSARQVNAIASEILSPDAMSRWRIVGGREIEHSIDGGATWLQQETPATSPLTTGSAPAPSICWIVGQDGVVLLTTDGRTWRRLGFPTTTTIVSIRATDERTATVTDAEGRTYVTVDGGIRWTQQ